MSHVNGGGVLCSLKIDPRVNFSVYLYRNNNASDVKAKRSIGDVASVIIDLTLISARGCF